MKHTAAADIVIFGGGIAGLWLLNRLRKTGLSVILFESLALGGGQTFKSQGIIHGGIKYALQGTFTNEARGMADLPAFWRQCLQGEGEIDLSNVPVLSSHQYLWAPGKLTSLLTGMIASVALNSKVERLNKEQYPTVFQSPAFKGDVYALDEIVIDVPSLIRELVKANQDALFKIEPLSDEELRFDDHGELISATVYMAGKAIEVTAQQFIFTAGAGNEVIVKKLKAPGLAMQRRPLHMVMAKMPFDYPLYAHCLGLGSRPRITITTHHTTLSDTIWYMGGQLAEEGIERDSASQIQAARDELRDLFPWLNFTNADFSTFIIDRAEPQQKGSLKPETCFMKAIKNVIVGWPTKLVLAPKLSYEIMQHLKRAKIAPHLADLRELRSWPMPPLAKPIWEDAFCKNVA